MVLYIVIKFTTVENPAWNNVILQKEKQQEANLFTEQNYNSTDYFRYKETFSVLRESLLFFSFFIYIPTSQSHNVIADVVSTMGCNKITNHPPCFCKLSFYFSLLDMIMIFALTQLRSRTKATWATNAL